MSEWRECNLSDVATYRTGKLNSNAENPNGIYPFFTCSPITLKIDNYAFDEEALLLAGNNANGVFALKYFKGKFNAYQRTYVISVFEHCDFKFLFYTLKLQLSNLEFISHGTATKFLTMPILNSIPILLPPLPEQKAIAEVLSSLDDKIDLLHRQNKTLEQMAETLFRQWFVEEAGEDWEETTLGELVTVKRGGSPRPIQDFLSDRGYRWLKISDATKEPSPFIFEIKEYIKEEGINKTTLLKAGKLVLSNSATPGLPKILQVDTCIHDGWLHFPESYFSNEFLYLLFKKIRPELLQQGNGSIFTNLKTDILKEYPIPIIDRDSLETFDNQIKPLFVKLLSNSKQIRTLESLRDTLLPKLMSGEIRVAL